MKYALAMIMLVSFVFAADSNVRQKKPVKKVYPKGTIATH